MARLITNLTAAGALAGADLVWLEQSGLPRKATMTEIAAFAAGGGIADGTVTSSLLRWSSSAWVEETDALLNTAGVLTFNNQSQTQLRFTHTTGPFGIRWAPSNKATSLQVDLVYRTTPEVVAFEQVSTGDDILVLDPTGLAVTIGGSLNLNDNIELRFGTGNDVQMDFDGTDLVMQGPGGANDWEHSGFSSYNFDGNVVVGATDKLIGVTNPGLTSSVYLRINSASDFPELIVLGTGENLRIGNFGTATGQVGIHDGYSFRVWDGADSDYIDIALDGTDVNWTHSGITDWNIAGITSIQAGTVDADFDAITATSLEAPDLLIAQTSATAISFTRSGHDSYRWGLAGSTGMFLTNTTDSRDEMVFDGTGDVAFDGTISTFQDFTADGADDVLQLGDTGTGDEGFRFRVSTAGSMKLIPFDSAAYVFTSEIYYNHAGSNWVIEGATNLGSLVVTGVATMAHASTIRNSSGSAQLRFQNAADVYKWGIGATGAGTDDFIIYDQGNTRVALEIDDTTGQIRLYHGATVEARTINSNATDGVSGFEMLDFDQNFRQAGFADMETNTKSAASVYTLSETDIHKKLRVTDVTGGVTFPNDTGMLQDSVGWIINTTTSDLTLTATSNNLEIYLGDAVAHATGNFTLAGKGWCTWTKMANDTKYELVGLGLS